MAKHNPSDELEAISLDDLAIVSGGRMIPRQGTDPMMIQGIQTLVKTISEVGAIMKQNDEKNASQMSSLMQQLMAKKKGGG